MEGVTGECKKGEKRGVDKVGAGQQVKFLEQGSSCIILCKGGWLCLSGLCAMHCACVSCEPLPA